MQKLQIKEGQFWIKNGIVNECQAGFYSLMAQNFRFISKNVEKTISFVLQKVFSQSQLHKQKLW